jgi:hypothetical protein
MAALQLKALLASDLFHRSLQTPCSPFSDNPQEPIAAGVPT